MSTLRKPALLFAAAAMLSIAACSKKDDSGAPSPVPPLPQGTAPPPPAAAPPPAPPPPPAPAPEGAAPAADAGGSITGKIELASAVAKKKPAGTLFLVARRISDNPSARGTLIAVKKMPATSFPLPFTLSAADMPFQNGAFDGDLTLTARIDQDGDPMSHQKGDIFGTVAARVGAHGVTLPLDQVQKETESLAGGPPPGHP